MRLPPLVSFILPYVIDTLGLEKAFRHPDSHVRVFRPDQNAARMAHSGEIICIPEVPESTFLEAISLAVGRNLHLVPEHRAYAANGSMYVRPLLFASGAQLALAPPSEFTFLVYVTPTGSLYGTAGGKAPAVDALVLHLFDRAAPMGTGSAKVRSPRSCRESTVVTEN